jgi:hypothetical protein
VPAASVSIKTRCIITYKTMKYSQLFIRHQRNLLIAAAVTLTLFGTIWMFAHQTGRASAATVTGQVCGNASTGNSIDTVIVVAEENRTWAGGATPGIGLGFSPTNMPYLNSVANQCAYFTNMTETNTSQNSATQYVGAWTGFSDATTHVASDCSPAAGCSYNGNDIFDVFRTAGIGHREYVEGATTPCSASGNAAKHIPELYMWPESQVSTNASCQAEVRPFSEFSWSNPPTGYSFITPTLCNDGHDCSDTTVDNWLSTSTRLPALYNSTQYQQGKVLFEVWYDEDRQKPNLFSCWSCSHVASTTDPTYAGEAQLWLNLLGAPTANLGAITTATDIRPIIMNGTVTPPTDNPPAVSITAPANNATLTTSPVTITANATDDNGVTKVEFYDNGSLINTDTTSPYSYSYDISALSGAHSLTAKAYDTASQVTTSAAVNVTVSIPPSCTVPTTLGTATQVVNLPTGGTYHVWSRIMAPDTTNNSYYVQFDAGCPIDVGDAGSMAANAWTWVDYQDGSTTTHTSTTLTSGNHTVTMIGREAGVKLDRVLLLSDTCVPTGTGANCVDTTAPTVSLTAPTSGQTVSGSTVSLAATAADEAGGSGLSKVDFKIDGAIVNTDTTSPYQYSWNSGTVADGSHTVQAVATDGAGNTTSTTTITVTVSNSDTTNPTISITAPTAGATVSGASVAVSAIASDNVGVLGVQFKLDGSNLGAEDTVSPYTINWNSTTATNASHVLTAVARDAAGNTATATSVSVTVNNAAAPPPGDLNGDNHVTILDLSILLSHYGQAATPSQGDINGDNTCNILDLSILLSHYGT